MAALWCPSCWLSSNRAPTPEMGRVVWRIAADTPEYGADDLSGRGAAVTGGRWNRDGTPMLYTSGSIALACLETIMHLGGMFSLPLNRYLVGMEVPEDLFAAREKIAPGDHIGWDAEPAGLISLDVGTRWIESDRTLILEVPSVVVPEEMNYLINPKHKDAVLLKATKVRRWTYDSRLRGRST